jgi:predicted nucleic acid-binding protein
MRVFLDANILFSAAKRAGAMRGFLAQMRSSGHTLVADAYVTSEARRNIEVKFPHAMGDFESLLSKLEVFAGVCVPLPPALALELPEKDRPVLAAALQHGCQVLVTGDKAHFGALYGHEIEGVRIHSPASLAEQL